MKRYARLLPGLGLVLTVAALLPCFLLGENGIINYHDQLDGELIAYILRARHLGGGTLPEFLNGSSKTALTPPAPACVLWFRVLQPLTALHLMQLLFSTAGYLGMFLLVKRLTRHDTAACLAGVLYAQIPFLPVYGLSQFGLPLLLWCVLKLSDAGGTVKAGNFGENENSAATGKKRAAVCRWLCVAYGVIFALHSSLVLVGYAVLIVLAIWIVWNAVRGRKWRLNAGLWLVMAAVYAATNFDLVLQVFGVSGEISHKTEYLLAPESFLPGFINGFLYGGQHSADHHIWILAAAVIVSAAEIYRTFREKRGADKYVKIIWCCVGCGAVFAVVSAVWNSAAGISLRGYLGAAGAFQMDRFLWLSPCLWYLTLGCMAGYGLEIMNVSKMRAVIVCCAVLLAAGACGIGILKDSDVKSNLQKLRNPEYGLMSYSDYYALGVYEQIEEYLRQETGLEQEEYRVVSLGIDPAAALYHGFYCLDGYSNNYSLEYKHAFRKVIAPALEKSEYLRAYFDEWGNRCYLFATEAPAYYTIEKGGFYYNHPELDIKALRELGGDYLFSAAYIADSDELGLALLRDEPFETPESYYRIYVYEVTDETD